MRRSILLVLLCIAAGSGSLQASYSVHDPLQVDSSKSWLRGLLGAKSDEIRYDRRMIEAAQIAASRAAGSSRYCCWRYVKEALVSAKVIDSYPKTRYAKEAATELQSEFGFRKLQVDDPYKAPNGAILVYGGPGPGHVEFRTPEGFVSDFLSPKPAPLPLIGVYVKPGS